MSIQLKSSKIYFALLYICSTVTVYKASQSGDLFFVSVVSTVLEPESQVPAVSQLQNE